MYKSAKSLNWVDVISYRMSCTSCLPWWTWCTGRGSRMTLLYRVCSNEDSGRWVTALGSVVFPEFLGCITGGLLSKDLNHITRNVGCLASLAYHPCSEGNLYFLATNLAHNMFINTHCMCVCLCTIMSLVKECVLKMWIDISKMSGLMKSQAWWGQGHVWSSTWCRCTK